MTPRFLSRSRKSVRISASDLWQPQTETGCCSVSVNHWGPLQNCYYALKQTAMDVDTPGSWKNEDRRNKCQLPSRSEGTSLV